MSWLFDFSIDLNIYHRVSYDHRSMPLMINPVGARRGNIRTIMS